jgi:hypothetical protein
MNREKLMTSIMTVATIGIILVLFSNSVQAAGTTKRPIDDWAGGKLFFMGVEYNISCTAWADPESGLWIWPHADTWFAPSDLYPDGFNFLIWGYKLLEQCPHHGSITEREVDEEHVLISINLHASEVPFMVFTEDFTGEYVYVPSYAPIYKGIMSYNFECKILFNTEMLNEWFAEHGRLPSSCEITSPLIIPAMYPPELVPVLKYIHMTGSGYITVGGEGRIVFNQVGLFDPDTGGLWFPTELAKVVP